MMMAFRRWGHFYLALSNEALRKRTQEQNQARIQVCGQEVHFHQEFCSETGVSLQRIQYNAGAHV